MEQGGSAQRQIIPIPLSGCKPVCSYGIVYVAVIANWVGGDAPAAIHATTGTGSDGVDVPYSFIISAGDVPAIGARSTVAAAVVKHSLEL